MAYIGVSPSNGVRQKHTYTATASQTTFSGAGSEGISLSYRDSNYVDVYRNGVKLGDADYTATSGTSIVLGEGAAVNDIIEIVTYDVFSVADTVSKADGGTFDGNVTMAGTLGVTGETTLSTHLNMGDSDIIKLGAGADLQIYHDASNSQIINSVGHLNIDNNGDDKQINLRSDDGSGGITNYIRVNGNTGAVQLYHYGSTKFATTLTGIDVTGTVVSDGMSTNTAGTSNFIAGVSAGSLIGSGANYNTFVGDRAGRVCSSGDNNVAIGFEALDSEIGGGSSVAVGYQALLDQNTSLTNYNTAVGYNAGKSITTGVRNTLIGGIAGDALTDADYNVAIGHGALDVDTKGSRSVAIGYQALPQQNFTSSTDTNNTAIGYQSGYFSSTGTENVFVGKHSGYKVTTGSDNTYIGVGTGAGIASSTGSSNTAVGRASLQGLTSGGSNVAVGANSLVAETGGTANVAVGKGTLLAQNVNATAYNTAVGHEAGNDITTGVENTLVGGLAGDALTDADFNVAIGVSTLTQDTRGSKTVAIGVGALNAQNFTSATDTHNVAVGFHAGNDVTTGVENTLIGSLAGDSITSSSSNTLVGQEAGHSITTGDGRNTFIGNGAGSLITSGVKNCIIGRYSGNADNLDIRTSDNRIVLSDGDGKVRLHINNSGYATFSNNRSEGLRLDATSSHIFHTSNSSIVTALESTSSSPFGMFIDFSSAQPDNNTNYFIKCEDSTDSPRFFVYSSGDVVNHDNDYGAISDVKLKEQITNASSQWDDIKALQIRKFKMKEDVSVKGDSDSLWRLGVIAQEVETAGMNGLVRDNPDMIENEDGEIVEGDTTTKSVKYSILYMKAVKALQEAMERIETLEQKVATLEGQ